MLNISLDLFTGYKLQFQSIKFQPDMENFTNISDNEYKTAMLLLINSKKKESQISAKNKKLLTSKLFLYSSMESYCKKKSHNMYYYDNLVKNNIMPENGDIIILGHNIEEINKTIPHILSFICISSIKKNPICISYTDGELRLFENLGILSKWSKNVITINLELCNKSNITSFINSL